MTLASLVRPWSGNTYRHIPARSTHDVLDFRFAGLAADNRWNQPGEPTLYLASDRATVVAEYARHLHEDRGSPLGLDIVLERVLYRLELHLDLTLDLCIRATWDLLSLNDAPACFLSKPVARAVANLVRHNTTAQAIFVPSIAFLDQPQHWVLALFLEKLPADKSCYIQSARPEGTLRLQPG